MPKPTPFLALLALGVASVALASPFEFTHTGRVSTAAGAPLDGDHDLKFVIHDAPSGGRVIWSETHTLSLVDGYFGVVLGRELALDPSDFNDQPLFLGIAVDGGPEFPTRQPLTAVPFAFHAVTAGNVDGGTVDASSIAVDGQTVVDGDGNVYATSVSVNGVQVIDENGEITATLDWSQIQNVPDGIEQDSLADLAQSCLPNEIVQWTGTAWDCVTNSLPPHTHPASDIIGQIPATQLPIGTGPGTVAAGSHDHDDRYYTRTEVDAGFYSRTLADASFYSKTDADARYYTRAQADSTFYSRTEADTTFYTRTDADARYYTRTQVDASHYSKAEADARFYPRSDADSTFLTEARASTLYYTQAAADAQFYPRSEADDTFYPRVDADTTFYPRSQLYTRTEADARYLTGSQASALYYPRSDLYTRAEVESLIATGSAAPVPLADRIQTISAWSRGWAYRYYRQLPDSAIRFQATGGPVEVQFSTPIYGNSASMHVTCRPNIDGVTAGIYANTVPTDWWEFGLRYVANGTWRMWDQKLMLDGIPKGTHLFTMECQTDHDNGANLGSNAESVRTVSLIPYDPPATAEVKAYSTHARGGTLSAGGQYTKIPNLSLPFTSQGGLVKISLNIPLYNGTDSHDTCRPVIDGTPAGLAEGDSIYSDWQEGLTHLAGYGTMWERSRLYAVPAGSHTLTVECRTNGGTLTNQGGDETMHVSAVAYRPATDSTAKVRAYKAVWRGQISSGHTNWKLVPDLSLTFTSNGGPVEIGQSIPMYHGSHSTCRPIVDGAPITAGEVDDPTKFWHNGLEYTYNHWEMWDRVRVYHGIPAGTHTLEAQCRTDTTSYTHYVGDGTEVSTSMYAIAYDQ